MAAYRKRVGPKADVAELEYVASLHQTSSQMRPTATISTLDVVRFLKSRHGVEISDSQACDIVMKLGGGMASKGIRLDVAKSTAAKIQSKVKIDVSMPTHERWKMFGSKRNDPPGGKNETAALTLENDIVTALKNGETEKTEELLQEILAPKLHYLDVVQMTSLLLIPTFARLFQKQKLIDKSTAHIERGKNGRPKEASETFKEGSSENISSTPLSKRREWSIDPGNSGTEEKFSSSVDNDVPNDLISTVLNVMIVQIQSKPGENIGGESVKVTTAGIQALLVQHGEIERANDAQLVQEMKDVLGNDVLDISSFLKALASDLEDWNVSCEDLQTSYIHDIFGTESLKPFERVGIDDYSGLAQSKIKSCEKHATIPRGSVEGEWEDKIRIDVEKGSESASQNSVNESFRSGAGRASISNRLGTSANLVRCSSNSFAIIDTVLDEYGSSMTLVLAWVTYIFHTGSYGLLIIRMDGLQLECAGNAEDSFGCVLLSTILNWMIVALCLLVFGFSVLLPLLYGNHPTKQGPARMAVATILVLIITMVPVGLLVSLGPKDSETVDEEGSFLAVVYTTTITGSILAINYFTRFCIGAAQYYGYEMKTGGYLSSFAKNTSHVVGSARLKQAGSRKVHKMLRNARSMHGETTNTFKDVSFQKASSDAVFENYSLRGESYIKSGSFLWVLEKAASGELFDTEGIFLPSRLVIFQFCQVAVSMLLLFAVFILTEKVAKAADKASKDLDPNLPQWFVDFIPTGAQVRGALIPASIVASIVCFFLVLIYIPNSIKTTVQFRSGQVKAFNNPIFLLSRACPDTAYMNTANAVYGTIAAASLFYSLIGGLLFLCIWPLTQRIVVLVVAWGLGLAITIVLKVLITSLCRKRFFRAFYRLHPNQSNFSTLALECWFIGLGGGILVGRITQFLLAAAFWIGRIDEPFLADNVSLFGYKFDYVPLNYTKEILLHEAHRHPYLERLGAMYLMRLRYKSFANSRACAAWRQLFVLTLSPWLIKYRVFHEQRCLESLSDQKSERQIDIEEEEGLFKQQAVDILAGAGIVKNFGMETMERFKQAGQAGIDTATMVGQVGAEMIVGSGPR